MPTTLTNTVQSANLGVALGSPTMANGDTVRLIRFASDFTAALDYLAGVTGLTVEATPGWTGNMGGDSGDLEVDTAALVDIRFGGQYFHLTGTATALVFAPARGDARLVLDAFDATNTDIERGTVLANGTSDLGTVTVFGRDAGAAVDIEAGANAVTAVHAGQGARVTSRRAVTNATLHAGSTLEMQGDTKVTGTVTLSGGTYKQAGSAGDVTVATSAAGGVVDLAGVSVATELTITGRGRAPTVRVPASGLVTVDASGFSGSPVMSQPVDGF